MKRKLLFLALSLVFITTLLCVVCSAYEYTFPEPSGNVVMDSIVLENGGGASFDVDGYYLFTISPTLTWSGGAKIVMDDSVFGTGDRFFWHSGSWYKFSYAEATTGASNTGIRIRYYDSNNLLIALISGAGQEILVPDYVNPLVTSDGALYGFWNSYSNVTIQEVSAPYSPPPPPPDGYTPPYGDAVSSFTSILDPRANNQTYLSLIDYYRGFGDSRFFDIKTLVSGTMEFLNDGDYSITIPIGTSVTAGATYNSSVTMDIDYFGIAIFNGNNDVPQFISSYTSGYFTYNLYVGEERCRLIFNYTVDGGVVPVLSFAYDGAINDGAMDLKLSSFGIAGTNYTLTDIYKIDISFVVSNDDDALSLSELVSTLYSVAPYYYRQKVYSPYDFYQGFKKSYNLGYLDAERFAYGYGYEAGHTDGYDEGYEDGLSVGAESTDSYQQGYDAAISDMDSGQFGRNFLGNMFSAPFEALGQFKIVSYTNVFNGNTEYITLGMVISAAVGVVLFWWFLKMFSGG